MDIKTLLYNEAYNFLLKRYPNGWGGVCTAYTDNGTLLTSVGIEVHNSGADLCIETGAILEAFKLDEKITHILTLIRLDEDSPIKIVTSCGICQERLSWFGEDLLCAISNPKNKLIFKTLKELRPYSWLTSFNL